VYDEAQVIFFLILGIIFLLVLEIIFLLMLVVVCAHY
tara:strand:+ start:272 stop:382 length:111 start_codon:yes stop_codon:yes gene_type:complete